MTREELKQKKEDALKMFSEGYDAHQVSDALKIGLSTAYKFRTASHSIKKTKKEEMRGMIESGMSDEDVAEKFSCNAQYVARCRLELGIKKPYAKRSCSKRQQIIEYRKAHHSIKETAEAFCVKPHYVKQCCRGLFIGYADGHGPNGAPEELEERARKSINSSDAGLEYIGGYSGSDRPVRVRCIVCGSVFFVNYSKFRGKSRDARCCPVCNGASVHNTLVVRTYMREWIADEERRNSQKEKARRKRIKAIAIRSRRLNAAHTCPVCGMQTTRRKYCCDECARKASNAKCELKKRKFMKAKVVDKDITLQGLYKRDRGVCWICGLTCDYGDYERRNGHFIAGNLYPSKDHIIARCEGGEHSWRNIKLAHRICNTNRYNWAKKDSTK